MTGSTSRPPVVLLVALVVFWLPFTRPEPTLAASSAGMAGRVAGTVAPLVFFRTESTKATGFLRRVMRISPRTGRSLRSVVPPADFRSFVDAVQVGSTSYLAWTSTRGNLWLASAGPSGRIERRWLVGRSSGFEVRPVPLYEPTGTGTGFLRVSANQRDALLVNGRGRRIGRFVDLQSGIVKSRHLPDGVQEDVADAAAVGGRFVLISETGSVVSLGPNGELLSRTQIRLPAAGPRRIGFVKLIPLSADHAALSFINGQMYRDGTRRFIARYNARNGALTIERSYLDFEGYEFAATTERFTVFGNDHWTTGRIDGGPLRQISPAGPGPRPPASAGIEPEVEGVARVFGSATGNNGQAFVFRAIDYENIHGMAGYVAYEVIQVGIANGEIRRRTRFGDETGGRSPLPFAFDIRVA